MLLSIYDEQDGSPQQRIMWPTVSGVQPRHIFSRHLSKALKVAEENGELFFKTPVLLTNISLPAPIKAPRFPTFCIIATFSGQNHQLQRARGPLPFQILRRFYCGIVVGQQSSQGVEKHETKVPAELFQNTPPSPVLLCLRFGGQGMCGHQHISLAHAK